MTGIFVEDLKRKNMCQSSMGIGKAVSFCRLLRSVGKLVAETKTLRHSSKNGNCPNNTLASSALRGAERCWIGPKSMIKSMSVAFLFNCSSRDGILQGG